MQSKELKQYLIADTRRIEQILTAAKFHDINQRNQEIRCALPDGENPTAVMIKLDESLYTALYELGYSGDLFGALAKVRQTDFRGVMLFIHSILGLGSNQDIDKLDPLNQLRSLSRGNRLNNSTSENKLYNKDVLTRFIGGTPKTLLEEGVSTEVIHQFSICYDPWKERVVFPQFDWLHDNCVVGIKGRTNLDSETAKLLGVPKYWNYIKGYRKSLNLYGFYLTKRQLEQRKMLIIFEGEKSVLKEYTLSNGKGISVALGGHQLSSQQINFLLKNTPSDCEIVLAFDKDVMVKKEEGEEYIRKEAEKFLPFKQVSYVYDSHDLLDSKDAPIDKGYRVWQYLLKWRKKL